jgi:hypothetical protein
MFLDDAKSGATASVVTNKEYLYNNANSSEHDKREMVDGDILVRLSTRFASPAN